jgi:hypothetical protein
MRELNDFGRGFPSYQDYAGSQELHKRPKRVGSLLWASSICFGLAAISLVALIAELL